MPQVASTPHKVVVTAAKTGPDRSLAGTQILNVNGVEFDFIGKRLLVNQDQSVVMVPLAAPGADGQSDNIKELDLASIATITIVLAAGAYTVTVA